MGQLAKQRKSMRVVRGFSLLELLIAIAILSLMVASISVAFTQLNDGINDAFVRKTQTSQFYQVENLFAIDFSYHNVGVDDPSPPCYLEFANNTWYSSCTSERASFAEDNDAIMLCYQTPQGETFREVAYYFAPDDEEVCRYQWETDSCDGYPSTGTDNLSSSVTSLSCDTSILEDVEDITFTNQANGATQIDVSFAVQAGVNQGTTIGDNFSVTLASRTINPDLVVANLLLTDYALRDGGSLLLTAQLDRAASSDMTIGLTTGALSCPDPCVINISEGERSGSITITDTDTTNVNNELSVSLLPGEDYILGQSPQADVTIITSSPSDADHTPSLSIIASHNEMSSNSSDITITLTLSQALTNAVDVELNFTGMACGASNAYVIAGVGATTTGCPGSTVTVTKSIAASTTSASFVIDPKSISTADRLTIQPVANSALSFATQAVFIDALPTANLPILSILSTNKTITIPYNVSTRFTENLRLGLDRAVSTDIPVSITTAGSLVCGTDYVFVGKSCSDTHTFEAHSRVLNVPIQWRNHTDDNSGETATFSLAAQNNVQIHSTNDSVTYTARELSAISFSAASSAGAEGTSVTVTVNASPAVSGGVNIQYEISGTASSADYSLSATEWTLANGASSFTITVSLVNDGVVVDPGETVIFTINEVYGKAYIGSQSVHTLTIN